MKRYRKIGCAAFVLALLGSAAIAEAEGKTFVCNDFLNDLNYYSEHFGDYENANWRYCYGDIEQFADMSFFAPQKSWMGTEAYCEIANGILHPGTNEMVIIIWTAPCGGTVSFDASATKKYHGVGDGSAFLIYNDKKELLFEAYMGVGDTETKTYADSYSMQAGENVYFVLDYVGNNWEDSTVFDIRMELTDFTPPADAGGCSSSAGGAALLSAAAVCLSAMRKKGFDGRL